MKTFLRDNGLSIALLLLFTASAAGQFFTGWSEENDELKRHGAIALDAVGYAFSGAFLSALFENWESEFLQMSSFVVLTGFLIQRGSPESKDPDAPEPKSKGQGILHSLYSCSLSLALFALFVLTFILHAVQSTRLAASEAHLHGQKAPGFWEHLSGAEFWFESFQNWQSEFLSTAVLVILAIFLRQQGSPESKPVDAPNSKTGAA